MHCCWFISGKAPCAKHWTCAPVVGFLSKVGEPQEVSSAQTAPANINLIRIEVSDVLLRNRQRADHSRIVTRLASTGETVTANIPQPRGLRAGSYRRPRGATGEPEIIVVNPFWPHPPWDGPAGGTTHTMRIARLSLALACVITLGACAHHPIDCAIGFTHADCLPGTAGYDGPVEPPEGWAAHDDAICKSYGLAFGTTPYAQCRESVAGRRDGVTAATAGATATENGAVVQAITPRVVVPVR
jgi:hypothetical protein